MTTIATLLSGGEGVGVGARAAGVRHLWGIEIAIMDDMWYTIVAKTNRDGAFCFLTPAGQQPHITRYGQSAPYVLDLRPAVRLGDDRQIHRGRFDVVNKVPPDVIIGITEIRVRLGPANRQHYHDIGYDVSGEYTIVSVKDMMPNSGVKVPIICPRCGKERKATIQKVNKTGHTYCKACVKYLNQFQDISGERFSRLVAIKPVGKDKQNATEWLCQCDCGKTSVVAITRLNNGMTSSCGCLRIERAVEAISGEKNVNYNPNLTDEDRRDRRVIEGYREWQFLIKKRDSFTCQICGVKGGKYLASHHLNAWFSYPEQRFDLNNGVCLCFECHIAFHSEYGRGHNTKQQFIEWVVKHA